MSEQFYLKGKMVSLRDKRVEDARDDYNWRVDDELARLDATRPLNMSYDSFLRYTREELAYPSPRSKRFAIDSLDGKHIGNIMYYDIDLRQGEAELGIMIGDREYWSKGYGKDAIDTLLDYIFLQTPLTRIYLHTLEWNHRARKSFARAGFREINQVRRSGMEFIRMEFWRSEWERRRAEEEQEAASQSSNHHETDGERYLDTDSAAQ